MATATSSRTRRRRRRHNRVRAKVSGSTARPRLVVFRTSKHISTQLIDDVEGKTLAAASDADVTVQAKKGESKSMAAARAVGSELSKRAKKAGIEEVVFDRGGFAYHGRIKALADAARGGGIKF